MPCTAALYRRARVYLQLGQHLEAVHDCRAALVQDPDNAQLRLLKEQITCSYNAAAGQPAAAGAAMPAAAASAALMQAALPVAASVGSTPRPAAASPQSRPSSASAAQQPAACSASSARPKLTCLPPEHPLSPDAFAGFDTPAANAAAKLCMVCMDADRGERCSCVGCAEVSAAAVYGVQR